MRPRGRDPLPVLRIAVRHDAARAADGRVEVGSRDFPTNRGGLCQKGWTAAELLDHPERLTTPLIAPGDGPATWDEAYSTDRRGHSGRIQQTHGRDAVAVFGGGGLTNEKAYSLGKFARVALRHQEHRLQRPLLHELGRGGRATAPSASTAACRSRWPTSPRPTRCCSSARNVAETMPPFARYLTEQRESGGVQIVVDPRATPTARAATLHLQPTPGTDLALALGLLHIVIAEGLADQAYLDERTTGWDAVRDERRRLLARPGRADHRGAGRRSGSHRPRAGQRRRAIILTARGAEQHAKGVDTVTAFINLALALGLPGRPGSGYGCLTGQGNGQGGREHGQKADQLPGYRRDRRPGRPRARRRGLGSRRRIRLPGPGLSAYELLDALGQPGGPKAMLVFGSNPVVSAPHADRHHRTAELSWTCWSSATSCSARPRP